MDNVYRYVGTYKIETHIQISLVVYIQRHTYYSVLFSFPCTSNPFQPYSRIMTLSFKNTLMTPNSSTLHPLTTFLSLCQMLKFASPLSKTGCYKISSGWMMARPRQCALHLTILSQKWPLNPSMLVNVRSPFSHLFVILVSRLIQLYPCMVIFL